MIDEFFCKHSEEHMNNIMNYDQSISTMGVDKTILFILSNDVFESQNIKLYFYDIIVKRNSE